MEFDDEYFGSEVQQNVSRRARNLWRLLPDDPHLTYNGRIMATVGFRGEDTCEKAMSLSKLQGATTCHFLPKDKTQTLQEAAKAEGLSTNIWEFCQGGRSAYDAALKILETHKLPKDITISQLTVADDTARIKEFASMTADCGVLAMAGRVIRGLDVPGITLAGVDEAGEMVGSAWGYKCYHADSEFSDFAFWDGLSCHPDRRGEKIALILGAQSIVQLWEKLGVRGFCTGITPTNLSSMSLCEKLGIRQSDHIALGVIDPATFGEGTLTK